MTDLKQIHEDVLAFLLRWRQERDPNLTFTLRRRPEERLRKGYWFEGNENGLVVSFWAGTDTEQNRPNIFVEVEKTGHVNLILSSRNDVQKAEFFEEVAGVLGGFAKYAFGSTWMKDYNGTDYEKSLKEFLENDKKRIDLYIQKTNERNPGQFFPVTDLTQISQSAFEKGFKVVQKYRSLIPQTTPLKEKPTSTIKQVTLHNWKSFDSAELYIDPLTVLIGLNASGKSNMIDALSLLQRLTQLNIYEALTGNTYVPELRGGIENVVLDGLSELTLTVLVGTDDPNQDYRYTLALAIPNQSDIPRDGLLKKEELFSINKKTTQEEAKQNNILYSKKALFKAEDRSKNSIRSDKNIQVTLYDNEHESSFWTSRSKTILSQLSLMKLHQEIAAGVKAVSEALTRIFILDIIPQNVQKYVRIERQLASDGSNIAGVLAALSAPEKAEIEKQISAFASRLPEQEITEIHAETVEPLHTDAMLLCKEKIGNRTRQVDVRSLSDGTLRFLSLIVAALTCPTGSLLVVEEIDNGIHPSRAKLLLEMLQEVGEERGVDVLATTHNVALLNQLTPDWYPFVTVAHRNPAGYSTLTLLEDVADLPRLMGLGPLGTVAANGSLEQALNHQPHEA